MPNFIKIHKQKIFKIQYELKQPTNETAYNIKYLFNLNTEYVVRYYKS